MLSLPGPFFTSQIFSSPLGRNMHLCNFKSISGMTFPLRPAERSKRHVSSFTPSFGPFLPPLPQSLFSFQTEASVPSSQTQKNKHHHHPTRIPPDPRNRDLLASYPGCSLQNANKPLFVFSLNVHTLLPEQLSFLVYELIIFSNHKAVR